MRDRLRLISQAIGLRREPARNLLQRGPPAGTRLDDVGTPTLLSRNRAVLIQDAVGASNRIEVNFQLVRELPHGRQLISRFELPVRNAPLELIRDLKVDRLATPEVELDHLPDLQSYARPRALLAGTSAIVAIHIVAL